MFLTRLLPNFVSSPSHWTSQHYQSVIRFRLSNQLCCAKFGNTMGQNERRIHRKNNIEFIIYFNWHPLGAWSMDFYRSWWLFIPIRFVDRLNKFRIAWSAWIRFECWRPRQQCKLEWFRVRILDSVLPFLLICEQNQYYGLAVHLNSQCAPASMLRMEINAIANGYLAKIDE